MPMRVRPAWLAALASALILTGCGSSPLDLRTVRWEDAAVPGSICGTVDPTSGVPLSFVQLHNGHAFAKSDRWPADYPIVEIDGAWDHIVYCDLNGDGKDEAAVGVYCSNGGGTADSILAYARVIFTAHGKTARVVGVIRPLVRSAPDTPTPLLWVTRLERGKVSALEAFYGRHDSTCCPSGRAVTTWALVDGKLVPRTTKITRSPR